MSQQKIEDITKNTILPFYVNNALSTVKQIFNEELFRIIATYISNQKKVCWLNEIERYANTVNSDVEFIVECYEDGSDTIDETLYELLRKWKIRQRFQDRIIREFLSKSQNIRPRNGSLMKRMKDISRTFNLSPIDSEILLLAYYYQTIQSVNDLVEIVNNFFSIRTLRHGNNMPVKTFAVLLGHSQSKIQRSFKFSAPLFRYNLIDEDNEISHEIIQYLEGLSGQPVTQKYYRKIEKSCIPLNEHFVSEQEIRILRQLHRHRRKNQGINILIYGEPGTGKTEFAISLSNALKAKLYSINTIDSNEDISDNDSLNFRYRAFSACQNTIADQSAVIVVDEADSILNSIPSFFRLKNSADKAQINTILDENKSYTIWITNYIDGMDESTKRRFNYAIQFKKMNATQRRKVWKYKIHENQLNEVLSKSEIEYFAENYEMNAGTIDLALKNISALGKLCSDKESVNEALEQFLISQYRLIYNKEKRPVKRDNLQRNYSIEGLNVNGDPDNTLKTLKNFCTMLNNNDKALPYKNLNVLLYGPPGTGKTEFARFISRSLHRKLIVKRGSDILSPYIGMTEHNIREAFEEACQSQSILFFDEIDSLLFGRAHATRGWELSQVNELLSGMENFRGIMLAATNLKETIDHAALRRFGIKLRFDYLDAQGNLVFYNKYFGNLVKHRLTKKEIMRLKSLKFLTPGDFKTVEQKYYFYESKDLSHLKLIRALESEINNKNEKVQTFGFAAN